MANEDSGTTVQQFRRNRPFFAVFIFAMLVAIGTFLYVLSLDTEDKDLERNIIADPNAPAAQSESAPAAAAPAEEAPAQ